MLTILKGYNKHKRTKNAISTGTGHQNATPKNFHTHSPSFFCASRTKTLVNAKQASKVHKEDNAGNYKETLVTVKTTPPPPIPIVGIVVTDYSFRHT